MRIFTRRSGALCALFLLLGGAVPAAHTAEGAAHDLLQIYLLTLENNPGYKARLASFRATAELQPQARARLFPQLGAQTEFKIVRQSVKGDFFGAQDINESETFDRFAYGVALSQAVYRRAVFLNLDRAELEVGRAKLLVAAARHDLMIRAAEAYFGLLAARDNLELVQAEKEAISRQFDQVQGRFDSGFVPESDVKAVQAQLDSVMATEIEAENRIDIARTRLEFLTGTNLTEVRVLPEDTPLPHLEPESLDVWLSRAQQHNIPLLARTVGVRVAELDTRIATSQYFPTLDIVGSHAYFDADGGISGARRDQDSRIGLVLNMPIFDGGGIQSRIREAEARAEERGFEQEEAEAEARMQTRIAYLNARAARAKADALVRAVESARSAEEALEVSFEVGSGTAAEFLSGVRERFRAERDLSLARYQYVIGLLRLRQAAGVMTAADLDALNTQLR